MEFKNKKELSLTDNKKMKINRIYGIDIDYFRKFKKQTLDLGENMTVIFGRNGTLKSTLMGLIAQPFRTEFKNIFNQKMQTKFPDVFRMSTKYDNTTYRYSIRMNIDNDLLLKEPIPLYPEKYPADDPKAGEIYRFRLVPSGRAQGDGYFNLPSVYTKLDRVYPLIDSKLMDKLTLAAPLENSDISDIGKFYERVLLRTDFNKSNLFETSLHPVAQVNLFNYLYKWSQDYNVQIIFNTHSLYLIQYALSQKNYINKNKLVINEIASRFHDENTLSIIKNPDYKSAFEELTLSKSHQLIEENIKVKIFCEDKVAEDYIKSILPIKISFMATRYKREFKWY